MDDLIPAPCVQQNKFLLATCYKHCNQGYRAVHLLRGSTSQDSRYLSALCCMDLKQYREAQQLLLGLGEAQVQAGVQLHLIAACCTWTVQQLFSVQQQQPA